MSYHETKFIASSKELILEARNGRMFILVDDEDRENEGDLVIPAQMATPQAINFMARFGRGLVCLAMTRARVEQLQLPLMAKQNGTRHETAFTISIEARDGVTTGISAQDRARTIHVASDATNGRDKIVTPGHVFPLMARDGGVLVRAGHTEAAVDIARLAGLNPAGVICEIMKDDGTMARLDDLRVFARTHGLKIGTIRDLIAYRRRHDHLVERTGTSTIMSEYGGQWRLLKYRSKLDGSESYVLQKGEVDPVKPTLVRVHNLSMMDDVLGQAGPRKRALQRAMQQVANSGSGVIVLLTSSGLDLAEIANDEAGLSLRAHGIGAQILADLGVHAMELLTISPQRTIIGLNGYGIDVCRQVELAN